MRERADNDGMSPPRAKSLQRGGAPAAGPAGDPNGDPTLSTGFESTGALEWMRSLANIKATGPINGSRRSESLETEDIATSMGAPVPVNDSRQNLEPEGASTYMKVVVPENGYRHSKAIELKHGRGSRGMKPNGALQHSKDFSRQLESLIPETDSMLIEGPRIMSTQNPSAKRREYDSLKTSTKHRGVFCISTPRPYRITLTSLLLHLSIILNTNISFSKPLVKLKVLCSVYRTSVQCFVYKCYKYVRGSKCLRGSKNGCIFELLVFVVLLLGGVDGRRDTDLHIGGIFPMEGEGGWQGGQACMPAAELALADVNNRTDLLSGFKLMLHSNDSKCEPGLGASVMYNLLYNPPQKLLLLAGCSTVCTTVAEAAKMWNLMVLCYGASSPALSDRARFPTLFRTHPSATVHNPTRIKLMQKFGWARIAILQQAEEVFISTVEDLEAHCKKAGIEIVTRQSFLSEPADAVRNLRRQDARVIVGLFYVVAARRVLCEVYKHKLYGKSYVWFFIGWYEDNWFETNLEREGIECTAAQMREAAEGHLTTEALMWNQNSNQTTISGMTSEDFRIRLNGALKDAGYDIEGERFPEGYQEAPLAYDAVWAVALAFNKTMEKLSRSGLSLSNFTYTNKKIADDIYEAINSTSFLGVSGLVAFSSQGDRIALTQIEQLYDNHYVKLGYYDTQADNLTWLDRERWVGGKVPPDRTVVVNELRTVSLPLFACMCALCVAGMLAAFGLIVFNTIHRRRRVILWSHPACNTVMLCGCCVCLAAAIALGLDGRWVPPHNFAGLCAGRAWLLATGFSMAYGAMFTKVWRVHRHTTKPKPEPKPAGRRGIHGWKLYTMVGGLLLVDITLLTAWQIRDPQQRRVETFPLEAPRHHADDVHIRPELEHCESEHNAVWLGVMYGYKGLVLVFGLFLAYETRSVKVRTINDSRYVGMSIYNVVVLCLITAPVTLVIASQQDAAFAFVSLAIVFCCFLSMALIFIPKVIEVIRHPTERAESGRGSGSDTHGDEDKYRELLKENDELQKLIAQKEERIRVLKQKLAEREAAAADLTQDVKDEHI